MAVLEMGFFQPPLGPVTHTPPFSVSFFVLYPSPFPFPILAV